MSDKLTLEYLTRQNAELKAKLGEQMRRPLETGGGGGHDSGMEGRVAALEKRSERIEGKLDGLVKDVSEIKGRLAGIPTTWQLVGLIFAIMGGSFAILRFGLPH